MFQEAGKLADNVVVLLNSDAWLVRKKGKAFMDAEHRKGILEEMECVSRVIVQSSDTDDSSSSAIMNFALQHPESKICFCNGGDRKDNKTIRESDTCSQYNVALEYGIGGNYKAASSSDLLDNYVSTPVERPWGRYKQLYLGKGYIVKELEIDPGKELSDQFHLHRSEHWIVLSGIGHLKQGATRQMPEREFYVPAGESVYIRPAQTHKLSNPGKTPLKIVEIWAGDILEEDDIIRLDVGPNYGE
jgi:mannose-6-phosphate isomerase-like protein (cupin superfamily)